MSRNAPPAPVVSPCVKVCAIDGESGLCLGCFRTLKEIVAWPRLAAAERAAINTALPGRRGQIRPEKLGPP
jgi:predicted Fe-S protein YdhL (DUF1289 family)